MKKLLFTFVALFLLSCNFTEKELNSKNERVFASNLQQTPKQESMERGGMIYTDFCMQCHIDNGKGIPGTYPPLAPSNWLSEKRKKTIHALNLD